MKSHSTCLSLTGLFHLAQCSLGPSALSQRVKFSSFLWPSSIPLCKGRKDGRKEKKQGDEIVNDFSRVFQIIVHILLLFLEKNKNI